MNVAINQTEGKTVVTLEGRLDTTNVRDFEKQIRPLFAPSQPDIVLDCSGFTYISSSGLRILLTLQKSVLARGGNLTLRQMRPEIREVFDMTGFSSIFTIE